MLRRQQADTGVQSADSKDEEQQQQQSEKKRPWWKTRRAKLAYAAGAILLTAFVVLLTLGLLGYLKKVGPFANLLNKQSTPSPANPLSTIPLMADPFATPPTSLIPTPTVDSNNNNLAGVATPTNQPIINAVRYCESPLPTDFVLPFALERNFGGAPKQSLPSILCAHAQNSRDDGLP